jgi:hypothetical protein
MKKTILFLFILAIFVSSCVTKNDFKEIVGMAYRAGYIDCANRATQSRMDSTGWNSVVIKNYLTVDSLKYLNLLK